MANSYALGMTSMSLSVFNQREQNLLQAGQVGLHVGDWVICFRRLWQNRFELFP